MLSCAIFQNYWLHSCCSISRVPSHYMINIGLNCERSIISAYFWIACVEIKGEHEWFGITLIIKGIDCGERW